MNGISIGRHAIRLWLLGIILIAGTMRARGDFINHRFHRIADEVWDLVFFDDFDDGSADGWTVQFGNFAVVDGEYYTENGPGQKSLATVDGLDLTDCVVEANLRCLYAFQAALVFRYTDNAHHYTFSVNEEGDCVGVEKYVPGNEHFGEVLGVNYSVSISLNTDYLVSVRLEGNQFTCFLDGEKVLTVTDDAYTSGQVGLRGQKADVFFDDFTVYSRARINVPEDYPTIQAAINAADEGDTILVHAGTYYEHVVVNKTVSLIGENTSTTIIHGSGEGKIVVVERSNVHVEGFTVRNGAFGIWLSHSTGSIITNNLILNAYGYGILVTSSNENKIIGNIVSYSPDGIYLHGSTNNELTGNIITRSFGTALTLYLSDNNSIANNTVMSNARYGIIVSSSSGNTFRYNNMTDNRYNFGVWGTYSLGLSSYIQDIDTSNVVDEKPIYYLTNQNNVVVNSVTFPEAGYLGIVNSTNVMVENIDFMNNMQGVLFAYVTNSTIKNVKASTNSFGVHLDHSHQNTILNNELMNYEDGWGIYLHFSNSNIVNENELKSSMYGVALSMSSNNVVNHNNFVNNTQGVYLCVLSPYYNDTSLSETIWDDGYPSGGNYWSDYAGIDEKSGPNQRRGRSDGIGDTPYIVDENSQDRYPLMNPWTAPDIAVINVTLLKSIVGQGFTLETSATVTNQGNKIEAFNVTAYANETVIQTKSIILRSERSKTITFTWNTTSVSIGHYVISTTVTPLPSETDTADNTYDDGWVLVTIPGDIDGDYYVGSGDASVLNGAYGTSSGNPLYVAEADIDSDGYIGSADAGILNGNYGKTAT